MNDARLLEAARAGDEDAFAGLVEPHRRALHAHCYRMLGSVTDAEDALQDALLNAWRGLARFEGRSSLRSWLYRIATNACLDVLRRRTPPLQPYPDLLLDRPGPDGDRPEQTAIARETIELTFLAALRLLPPRQRAALIVRDVLGWSATETATLLDCGVPAANSALQRARATLREQLPDGLHSSWPAGVEATETEVLRRYIDAHERADAAAVIDLLAEDPVLAISGLGQWRGRESVANALEQGLTSPGEWLMTGTRANGHPCAAAYLRPQGTDLHQAFALIVLDVRNGAITSMTAFETPFLFPFFGLPLTRCVSEL
ncbi:MAG TPA: sigma-70 family RNA polymerase sigma factor [Agromyces sp.]